MREFLVVIGQHPKDNDCYDRFNIKLYKVTGESLDDVIGKVKSRTAHWDSLDIQAYIMEIMDLETLRNYRREVEFLGSFWMGKDLRTNGEDAKG